MYYIIMVNTHTTFIYDRLLGYIPRFLFIRLYKLCLFTLCFCDIMLYVTKGNKEQKKKRNVRGFLLSRKGG